MTNFILRLATVLGLIRPRPEVLEFQQTGEVGPGPESEWCLGRPSSEPIEQRVFITPLRTLSSYDHTADPYQDLAAYLDAPAYDRATGEWVRL